MRIGQVEASYPRELGDTTSLTQNKSREAVERARNGGGPTLLECVAYRMVDHNTVEDSVYRDEDEMEVREQLHLSLSYDHRLVDGVTAAGFADHVIESIEDPDVPLARL